MRSRVSEKGQVTIPKQLRDRLGIGPGNQLDFSAEDGRLVAHKVQDRSPVDAVYGILDLPGGTDSLVEALRGPVDLL